MNKGEREREKKREMNEFLFWKVGKKKLAPLSLFPIGEKEKKTPSVLRALFLSLALFLFLRLLLSSSEKGI